MLVKGDVVNRGLLRYLDVDLVTILTAYLLVHYGKSGAGIFAICQGFIIDIISAGVLGLFTLLSLITFFCINLGSFFFDLNSIRGQIILISLAVLVKETLLMVLLRSFSLEINVSSNVILSFGASALCTGLIGPLLFSFINQTIHLFVRGQQEN